VASNYGATAQRQAAEKMTLKAEEIEVFDSILVE
jgi:hypothetical protein